MSNQTYVMLSALRPDGAPHGALVHEQEYEGVAAAYFARGSIQEGSAREEGTVEISGAKAHMLEPFYTAER